MEPVNDRNGLLADEGTPGLEYVPATSQVLVCRLSGEGEVIRELLTEPAHGISFHHYRDA